MNSIIYETTPKSVMNSQYILLNQLVYRPEYQSQRGDLEQQISKLSSGRIYKECDDGYSRDMKATADEQEEMLNKLKKDMEEHTQMIIQSFMANIALSRQQGIFNLADFKRKTCPDMWYYTRTRFYDWNKDPRILALFKKDAVGLFARWTTKQKIIFILHNCKVKHRTTQKRDPETGLYVAVPSWTDYNVLVWWCLHQKGDMLVNFIKFYLNGRVERNPYYKMRCGYDQNIWFEAGSIYDMILTKSIVYYDKKFNEMSKTAFAYKYEKFYKTLVKRPDGKMIGYGMINKPFGGVASRYLK